MTRPTILDLDLVVVPREATDEMLEPANFGYSPDKFATLWDAMLSASPYPTAWDDVRKYVEGLERRLAELENLAMVLEAESDTHKAAAEARIAELEKRLADAERVIEPFARAVKYSEALNRHQPDEPKSRPHDFLISDEIRAARAYMEGK